MINHTIWTVVMALCLLFVTSSSATQRSFYYTKSTEDHAVIANSSLVLSGCEFILTDSGYSLAPQSLTRARCRALSHLVDQDVMNYKQITVYKECEYGPYGRMDWPTSCLSDVSWYSKAGPVSGVRVWTPGSGRNIVGIQFQYGGTTWASVHGRVDGTALPEVLMNNGPNERITSVSGTAVSRVNHLSFSTSTGRDYGPYGNTDGQPFSTPTAHQLLYANACVDSRPRLVSISFVFSCASE